MAPQHPVSQRTVVFLHDDHIGFVDHTIVVHRGDSLVQPKVLQATNLSEDVVEDTPFVDTFGEIHLFYGHLSGFLYIGLTAVDHSIGPRTYFPPVFVMAQVGKSCR